MLNITKQGQGRYKIKVVSRSRSFQDRVRFKDIESYVFGQFRSSLDKTGEEEEDEFAPTRPVGFAAGKNLLESTVFLLVDAHLVLAWPSLSFIVGPCVRIRCLSLSISPSLCRM